jgi:hypothetical protein
VAESAQFKNTRNVHDVQHTAVTSPTIASEHVHHHVHEIIQPVVEKETIQPSVVHTTIPIHEIHQNEPKHHSASQLAAVTMDEFKRQGGYLGGREEHTDSFEGEPKSVGGTLGGARAAGTTSLTDREASRYDTSRSETSRSDTLGTGTRTTDTSTTGRSSTGRSTADSTTAARTAAGTAADMTATNGTGAGTGAGMAEKTRRQGSTSSGGKRLGLIDKLNPMRSSDEGRGAISGTVH